MLTLILGACTEQRYLDMACVRPEGSTFEGDGKEQQELHAQDALQGGARPRRHPQPPPHQPLRHVTAQKVPQPRHLHLKRVLVLLQINRVDTLRSSVMKRGPVVSCSGYVQPPQLRQGASQGWYNQLEASGSIA